MDNERDELRLAKFKGGEGEDFELWSLRLSAILESKDLADVVYECQEAPVETNTDARAIFDRKVRKARAIIITSLGDKPLRVVQAVATSC